VVFIDNNELVAAQGSVEYRIALSQVPITRSGAIGFQVENVMASVAAAWAADTDWAAIREGLRSFANDTDNAPGRFNLFNYRGATLIADYGHNPDAMLALVGAVNTMPARRRSVVISGAGDRRDEDIRQQTRILGEVFDEVVLYQDQCQRGREDGEVITLLREGLQGAKRTTDVKEIRGEFVAIDTALESLGEGDLCLILVDQVDEALAYIAGKVAQAA
jgi:cyanophycin synthetase